MQQSMTSSSSIPSLSLIHIGVIENGKNGFLFRNEEEFTRAIRAILGEPGLKERLSCAATESVERYSKEAFGDRMEALMLSVVKKAKEGGTC